MLAQLGCMELRVNSENVSEMRVGDVRKRGHWISPLSVCYYTQVHLNYHGHQETNEFSIQCWLQVGTPTETLVQPEASIDSMFANPHHYAGMLEGHHCKPRRCRRQRILNFADRGPAFNRSTCVTCMNE